MAMRRDSREGCDYLQAMLLAGGRVYIFEGHGTMARNRPWFDAFLSTVHLEPGAADDRRVDATPSPR